MLNEGDAHAAARLLARGREARTPMHPLPAALRPADESEAYDVQRRLHPLLGSRAAVPLAGYKIGCTSRVMQRYLNIDHPCAGGILAPGVHHGPATLSHADFCRVGVECELAVRLGADLPRGEHRRDDLLAAVSEVMPAIEVVDDRWHDFDAVDPFTLTADDFFGAGCVLGPPHPPEAIAELRTLEGRMHVNGEVAGEGSGADILGDPLEALAWLARSTATADGLLAGQVILLGSMVKTCWLAAGDTARVEIQGLGEVSATFA